MRRGRLLIARGALPGRREDGRRRTMRVAG